MNPPTFRMNIKETFNAIFWALFVLMFLMRFWFGFRVWRTGERLTAERGARQREGLWTHVVGYVFHLLLGAFVLYLWLQGGSLRRFAFPAPDWLRWAGVGLGMTSVGLFAWTHQTLGQLWRISGAYETDGATSFGDPRAPGRTEERAVRISRLLARFAFAHRYLLRHSARMRTLPP